MTDLLYDDLIDLANQKSFDRGEDYYENGYVKNIVKRGDVYEGIVLGSEKYKVTLDMSYDMPDFECSCPYDFGGICKHAVAFGLAVINEEFKDKVVSVPNANQILPDKFKACYENADTQKKLDFLKQILDKDTDLQSQFSEFVSKLDDEPANISLVDIETVKEEVFDALTSIDFNDIFESHDPYSYGYYDDEGYIDEAYDAITEELGNFTDKAVSFLKKGNLTDGLRILTGMYEGIQNLPEIDDCDYDIFGDSYDREVFEQLKNEFKKAFDIFETTIKSEQQAKEAVDLLFSRYTLKQGVEVGKENEIFFYDLKVFERVLIALIINQQMADYVQEQIKKNNLGKSPSIAYVMMKIAETSGDEKRWIENAEKYAEFEPTLARQLMEKYKKNNKSDDFNRMAEMAFKKWPDVFALCLIENLDKESKKTLYVKALKQYVPQKRSKTHYLMLREYISPEERIKFVDKQKDNYDMRFYINLLEIEKRYEDILHIAKTKDNYYFDYTYVLAPIVNIYPDECIEIIKKVCNRAMTSSKRKRSTYEYIANLLNVMLMIKTKQIEALEYIKTLYNHKPNLPALKDVFRNNFPDIFNK